MKNRSKILYWAPRILSILAILFVSVFALDAFDPELTFGQQIKGFLIHMIPSFVLLGILILAWKKELIGGIIYIVIGVGLSPFIFKHNYNMNDSIWMSLLVILVITFPFIVAGTLFVISHYRKRAIP
jgi:hypothetical protein